MLHLVPNQHFVYVCSFKKSLIKVSVNNTGISPLSSIAKVHLCSKYFVSFIGKIFYTTANVLGWFLGILTVWLLLFAKYNGVRMVPSSKIFKKSDFD
jgi:hypothetical protein